MSYLLVANRSRAVKTGIMCLGCVLWADDAGKRVRFYISPDIIDGVLKGENSVHDHQNVELCVRERTRLEEACQRAFDDRPGHYVELQTHDFR